MCRAGPLGHPVEACYGSSTKPGHEGLAVIEMASASGTTTGRICAHVFMQCGFWQLSGGRATLWCCFFQAPLFFLY